MATTTHYIAVSAKAESALSQIVKEPVHIHDEKDRETNNTRTKCSKYILTEPLTETQFSESQKSLPTYAFRDHILSSIQKHSVTVIAAETGSGKSTQIVQYIMAEHKESKRPCRIVCVLPKRLAVKSIAKHVAAECKSTLGQAVGYQVRLDDCTSPKSTLIFMTR